MNKTSGQGLLAVQFTDQSWYSPTSWNWSFGDGSVNSTNQNPVHVYTSPGTYPVTLTSKNSYGSSSIQKVNYITVAAPPAFLNGWANRKLHTLIGSSSGDLADYQMRFTIWNQTGTDNGENVYIGSKSNPDYSDLRITTTDNQLIPYWIQELNSSAAIVWAKIPVLPQTGTQVYLYYGNSGAPAVSNGESTFDFFDHFTGNAINTSKWNPSLISGGGSGSVSVSNDALTLSETGGRGVSLRMQNPVPPGTGKYQLGEKLQVVSGGSYAQYRVLLTDPSSADPGGNNGLYFGNVANVIIYTVNSVSGQYSQSFTNTGTYLWTISDNGKLLKDGSPEVILTNSAPAFSDANRYLRFWVYNYAVVKMDWVFAGKYATPEPVHGGSGVEEVIKASP